MASHECPAGVEEGWSRMRRRGRGGPGSDAPELTGRCSPRAGRIPRTSRSATPWSLAAEKKIPPQDIANHPVEYRATSTKRLGIGRASVYRVLEIWA